MTKDKVKKILDYFDSLYSSYQNFLNFNNLYELTVAVILSAQTTDARVNLVTKDLFLKYPDVKSLAIASYDDVYQLVKSLGLAKNKAKNIILMSQSLVTNYNGEVPHTFDELITLPGVGRKTANVILAVGYQIPALAVDTHVKRIAIRLGFAKAKDDIVLIEEKLKKEVPQDRWIKFHHQAILFGRNICLARGPKCEKCLLQELCSEYRRRNRQKIN